MRVTKWRVAFWGWEALYWVVVGAIINYWVGWAITFAILATIASYMLWRTLHQQVAGWIEDRMEGERYDEQVRRHSHGTLPEECGAGGGGCADDGTAGSIPVGDLEASDSDVSSGEGPESVSSPMGSGGTGKDAPEDSGAHESQHDPRAHSP